MSAAFHWNLLAKPTALFGWLLFTALSLSAQTNPPPIIISEPNSTRAIALDSVTFSKEPFSINNFLAPDNRTRVMIFGLNLSLEPNEFVTADAEDSSGQVFPLQVEYVGAVPSLPWLNSVILRLNENLSANGDVLISLTRRSQRSNRVRIGIGSIGGGPTDDQNAHPTPAPPYQITGRVLENGLGLAGVSLVLSGHQSGSTTTDASGAFSFLVSSFGDYTVTASRQFFDFTPSTKIFTNLSNNQPDSNFIASRKTHDVSGKVVDDENFPVANVNVTLEDLSGGPTRSTQTNSTGNFSFSTVSAGFNYRVALASTSFFTFDPQNIQPLEGPVSLNFSGNRRVYSISGTITTTNNQPLSGIAIFLNQSLASTLTASDGSFNFNNLPAGRDYRLQATTTPFYELSSPQLFTNLSGSISTSFTGTLRKYNISGNVKLGGAPYVNKPVTLSGATNAVTTTDANGSFVFSDLNAQADYSVSPAETTLRSFPTQTIVSLNSDKQLTFTDVPRKYRILGTITDTANNPLPYVKVVLGGDATDTTRTNSSGQFSIAADVLGDYTITPEIEQNYYSFSPVSRSVDDLFGDQVVNFAGTIAPLPNPHKVLEFDGSPKSVDYGEFWPSFTDLGHFYWEFWAMPNSNAGATYMLTDGYGGFHALLFGVGNFSVSEPNRYQFFGNMHDGFDSISHVVTFGGDQGPAIGEWGHFAVGWDGQNIITYMNGVPVGKTRYATRRRSMGPGFGAGRLLIGGSDHSNFHGRIAQVRGFENNNPRESTSVESSFTPQTVFSNGGNLLSWYFTQSTKVADMSVGYLTGNHLGTVRGTITGVVNECTGCPVPQFVNDTTAPNFATNTPSQPVLVPTPQGPPSGALVFDSFSRANSTYTFGSKGGLGSTESGLAGPQVWQMTADADQKRPFGILNGLGVVLADDASMSWVNSGSTTGNLDVRVDRRPRGWGSGVSTGLSFRVRDTNNFFFAYTNQAATGQMLTVGYYLDGFRNVLVSDLAIPNGWTSLRVVTLANGNIRVLVDATQVYTTTQLVLSRETGAGLYSAARGMGLVNRWDNFRVFIAP